MKRKNIENFILLERKKKKKKKKQETKLDRGFEYN